MKKHLSIALVVALVLCMSVTAQVAYGESVDSVKVTSTPSRYRYCGFSNSTTKGSVGVANLNNKCKAQFGLSARMCTSQEILTSYFLPNATASKDGWIKPSHIQLSIFPDSGTSNKFVAIDAPSGVVTYGEEPSAAADNLNCNGWSPIWPEAGTTGMVVRGLDGGMGLDYCQDEHQVACCKP